MLILSSLVTFLLSAVLSECTAVATETAIQHGNHFPLLKLPYGTWRAHHYNDSADVSYVLER